MHNLDQIFKEASNDFSTCNLSAENYYAFMLLGVKITKDEEGLIKIYDPTKKGEYYRECSDQDYLLYTNNGWKRGVYLVTLQKYKEKLENIKKQMAIELNTTKSMKRIKLFKQSREQITKKYYLITQKLNQNE